MCASRRRNEFESFFAQTTTSLSDRNTSHRKGRSLGFTKEGCSLSSAPPPSRVRERLRGKRTTTRASIYLKPFCPAWLRSGDRAKRGGRRGGGGRNQFF